MLKMYSLGVKNRDWEQRDEGLPIYIGRRSDYLTEGSWPQIHLASDKDVLLSELHRDLGGCHTLYGSYSSNNNNNNKTVPGKMEYIEKHTWLGPKSIGFH